nr:MAG TPA: hypothetical protein [Caudoviricetes sp.]
MYIVGCSFECPFILWLNVGRIFGKIFSMFSETR